MSANRSACTHFPQETPRRVEEYGATLSPAVDLRAGDYADLADAVLVIITAEINEKAGAMRRPSEIFVGIVRLGDAA